MTETHRLQNCHTQSKIEKVPRGIRGEKSSNDMASSRNLVSTIGALASTKMGDGTKAISQIWDKVYVCNKTIIFVLPHFPLTEFEHIEPIKSMYNHR